MDRKRWTSEDVRQKEEREDSTSHEDMPSAMPGMNKVFPSAFLFRHQLKPSGPVSHISQHAVDGSLPL